MDTNYSFYLFVQLRMAILPSDAEYDLQYEEDKDMYGGYFYSEYNNPDKSEYECMEEFLNYIKVVRSIYRIINTDDQETMTTPKNKKTKWENMQVGKLYYDVIPTEIMTTPTLFKLVEMDDYSFTFSCVSGDASSYLPNENGLYSFPRASVSAWYEAL